MIEEEGRGTPHGALFVVGVVLVVVLPMLLGDQGEPIRALIAELLSPIGLILVSIILILVIKFISSARGGSVLSNIISTGEPDSIHRLSGSPLGVALFVLLVIFLLQNRVSLFGTGEGD